MKTSSLLNLVTVLCVAGVEAATPPCPSKCNIDAATISLEGVSQAFDYLRRYTFEAVNTLDCLLKRQKLYALCGGLIDRVEGLAEISEDLLKASTTGTITKASERLIRPAQNHLGQVQTLSVGAAAPNDQCTWQGDFQADFAKGQEAIQNAFKTLSVLGSLPRCHPEQCQELVEQYSQDIKAIQEAVQTIESTINICASLTKDSVQEDPRCPVNACDLRAASALVDAAVTINPYVVGQADAVTTPCQCALVRKAYNQNAIALAQVVYFALSAAVKVFKPQTPKASRPGECAQRYADIINIANASVSGAQKAIDGIRCCSSDNEVIFNAGLLDVFANTYEAVPLGFLLAIDFCNTTCHCPCRH